MTRQPVYPPIAALVDLLSDTTPESIGSIAERMGVSRRAIEKGIEELKRSGFPVICGSRGCMRATTKAELRAAYRSERRRALQQMVNTRGRLKAIAALERQTVLFPELAA